MEVLYTAQSGNNKIKELSEDEKNLTRRFLCISISFMPPNPTMSSGYLEDAPTHMEVLYTVKSGMTKLSVLIEREGEIWSVCFLLSIPLPPFRL